MHFLNDAIDIFSMNKLIRIEKKDLIEIYILYKGYTKLDVDKLFVKDLNVKGSWEQSPKLEKLGCTRDRRKYFSHRVVWRWNALCNKWWMQLCQCKTTSYVHTNNKLRHTRLRFLWFKRSLFHRTTGCPVRKDYCYHSTAVVLHFPSTPHKIQVKIPWPACVEDMSTVDCDVIVVGESVVTVIVSGPAVQTTRYQ